MMQLMQWSFCACRSLIWPGRMPQALPPGWCAHAHTGLVHSIPPQQTQLVCIYNLATEKRVRTLALERSHTRAATALDLSFRCAEQPCCRGLRALQI